MGRASGRSCIAAWVDHMHGWSLCGLPSAVCKACGEEYVDRTQLHNRGWQGGSVNMLRASVEAVEVCTSSGLISRMGCTNRQHFGRREEEE